MPLGTEEAYSELCAEKSGTDSMSENQGQIDLPNPTGELDRLEKPAKSDGNRVPAPKTLVGKLAEVMGQVERVSKTGRNQFFQYDYVTESDLT
jgi:hypothetical protein